MAVTSVPNAGGSIWKMGGLSRLRNYFWGVPALPLPEPYKEQGRTGTAVWGGYPQIKDRSPEWVGRRKWMTASDLVVNASVVAAGVHYFLNLIAHPKWMAQPSDPYSHEAKDMADFVNDVLANTEVPWPTVVRQAGMYRFHGFSTQEWIACRREKDGFIGVETIESRPQHTIERWALDDKGSVIGVFQRDPQTSQLLGIPRSKLIYIVENTLTDSPDGLGVFRHLLEPWNRLKRFLELEVRAYERDLRGIPVGRAPLSAINAAVSAGAMTADNAKALIQGIEEMIQLQVKQSETGIMLDSATFQSTTSGGPLISDVKMYDLELLNGPGLGLTEISNAIDRVQREMARVMGIEHLMMGDQGGNRAVAQDKSRNVYLIASSVLRQIVASMQRDILIPLWDMNGFDRRVMPKLMAEDIAPRDVTEVTTSLARMSQAGAVLAPDDPVVNDVRDMLGVSRIKPPAEPAEGGDGLLSDMPVEPVVIPRALPTVGDNFLPDDPEVIATPAAGEAAGTGELDANGQPLISSEMQRLPRQGALAAAQ